MRKSSTRSSSRRRPTSLTLNDEGLTIRDAATGKAEGTLPDKGSEGGGEYTIQAPGKPMRILTPMSQRHIVLRADGAQFVWLHSFVGARRV